MIKKIGLTVLLLIGSALLIIAGLVLWISGGRPPEAVSGPAAELLAERIEASVNMSAWRENTAAIEFVFLPRQNRHFRDLRRQLIEVRWGTEDHFKVQYNNRTGRFIAFKNDERLRDASAEDAYRQAVRLHTNDFFWLNPFATLRAPGAERKLAGERALLLTFNSGGVTPGDNYLIITDGDGQPQRWQLWVSLWYVPNGIEFAFNEWTELSTGARVALKHPGKLASIDLEVKSVYGDYPPIGEADRFQDLLDYERELATGGSGL
ncbi:MAG: hypothetical protein KDK30_10855 [Leptospiraceae bacterium]|nr:hypothetical protein [Leptospiraceae bacterium]MCB1315204.1 hypothetical protein [Leptospiraceae bacterium]